MIEKLQLWQEMVKLAPSKYTRKQSLSEHLSNLFRQYISLLQQIDKGEFAEEWDERIARIQGHCKAIEETIRLYYRGLYLQAYQTLKGRIELLPKWFMFHKIPCFRMRVLDDGIVPTFEAMFHIPFDRRGIVRTQRYSTPGFPCLYLGFSPHACWEEMGRPDLNKTYISLFEPQGFYKFLNFSIPYFHSWMNAENGDKVFKNDLEYFPFVISSMVKVCNHDDAFKPEYIVPQLVMQWLLENRMSNNDADKSKHIGVLYTSVYYDLNEAGVPVYEYYNLAIPAYYEDEQNYSTELKNCYMYTNPVLCSTDGYEDDIRENRKKLTRIAHSLKDRDKHPLKKLE